MSGENSNVIVLAEGEVVHAAPEATQIDTHAETVATGHEAVTFPPFDPTTFASQLLWLAISFGALYLLMSRVALPRIGEILEVRRDRIEGDLAEADRLRQKTDDAIAAYEAALADARAKAHAIAEGTRQGIKAENSASQAEVEADIAAKVAAAEAGIRETKAAVLANVDQIAAEAAQAVVAALGSKVGIADARKAVAEALKG